MGMMCQAMLATSDAWVQLCTICNAPLPSAQEVSAAAAEVSAPSFSYACHSLGPVKRTGGVQSSQMHGTIGVLNRRRGCSLKNCPTFDRFCTVQASCTVAHSISTALQDGLSASQRTAVLEAASLRVPKPNHIFSSASSFLGRRMKGLKTAVENLAVHSHLV